MKRHWQIILTVPSLAALAFVGYGTAISGDSYPSVTKIDNQINKYAQLTLAKGRQIFRYDTFGDEAFWGDTVKLHQAIQGTRFGGVGPGVSPNTALAVGLKVDVDALPIDLVASLKKGQVNLDDPAITLALMKLNAVIGVTGFFEPNGQLRSIGIQCALCHTAVDNSLAPGIGHRLDGWANRDLNVGAIINLAPDLSAVAALLEVDEPTVRNEVDVLSPHSAVDVRNAGRTPHLKVGLQPERLEVFVGERHDVRREDRGSMKESHEFSARSGLTAANPSSRVSSWCRAGTAGRWPTRRRSRN